jgi:hypothetical protein
MKQLDQRYTRRGSNWRVLIFQTATHGTQQEILRRFAALGHDDVTVLGASGETGHFIVAECQGPRGQMLVNGVVAGVDQGPRLLHVISGSPRPRGLPILRNDPGEAKGEWP